MNQKSFKNFVLYKPRTKYSCKGCCVTYKVYGDTWLEVKKSCKAVDGTKAFRIFWLCHNGHRKFRGYSRPVSWKKNLGGDKILGSERSFAEEDDEIEKEFEEMVEYAAKMKNSGTGKLYF